MGFKYNGVKLYFKKKTAVNNRRKGETTVVKHVRGEKFYRNKKY
jgi:hypothetical protein